MTKPISAAVTTGAATMTSPSPEFAYVFTEHKQGRETMSSNIEIVQTGYAHFAEGEIE
jgi:hypothetical protein